MLEQILNDYPMLISVFIFLLMMGYSRLRITLFERKFKEALNSVTDNNSQLYSVELSSQEKSKFRIYTILAVIGIVIMFSLVGCAYYYFVQSEGKIIFLLSLLIAGTSLLEFPRLFYVMNELKNNHLILIDKKNKPYKVSLSHDQKRKNKVLFFYRMLLITGFLVLISGIVGIYQALNTFGLI